MPFNPPIELVRIQRRDGMNGNASSATITPRILRRPDAADWRRASQRSRVARPDDD